MEKIENALLPKKGMHLYGSGAVAAFLLPPVFLIFLFFMRNMIPFGDWTLHQEKIQTIYYPFAEAFQKALKNGILFLFESNGTELDLWVNLSYHGVSPLNGILLLFPMVRLQESVSILFMVRAALSGLFMYAFLRKKDHIDTLLSVALATFYSLGSVYLFSYQDIFWGDIFWLLPLFSIGLLKLLSGERCWLFSLALFGVCLCSVPVLFTFVLMTPFLFFLLYDHSLVSGKKRFSVKALLQLLVKQVFVGVFSAAIFWLPVLCFYIRNGFLYLFSEITLPDRLSFSLFEFLRSGLFIGRDEAALPFLYVGVLFFLLLPLYFLNSLIPFHTKIKTGSFFVFLYFSMNLPAVNRFLNLFSPRGMNGFRQSLYLFFFLFVISATLFRLKDGVQKKYFFLSSILTAAFLIISKQLDKEIAGDWNVVSLLVVLFFYSVFLVQWKKDVFLLEDFGWEKVIAILLFLEILMSNEAILISLQSRNQILSREPLSLEEEVISKENTPELLFSELLLSEGELIRTRLQHTVAAPFFADGVKGMVLPSDAVAEAAESEAQRKSPFFQANRLYETMGSEKPYEEALVEILSGFNMRTLSPCDFSMENEGIDTVFTVQVLPKSQGELFFYIDTEQNVVITYTLPGEEEETVLRDAGRQMVSLGRASEPVEVKGRMLSVKNEHIFFHAGEIRDSFSAEISHMVSFEKTNMTSWTGYVTVEEGEDFLFFLPYNYGWKLRVDGKEQSINKGSVFFTANISSGEHELSLTYLPPGLKAGAVLSFFSVIGIFVLEPKRKKTGRKTKRKAEEGF